MIKIIISSTFLLFCISLNAQKPSTIAFYNVENLFDTIDGTNDDAEFLPSAKNAWNSIRYMEKLKHIREVLNTAVLIKNPKDRVIPILKFNENFILQEAYDILNENQPRVMHSKEMLEKTMGNSKNIMFFGNEMRQAFSRWSLHRIKTLFENDKFVTFIDQMETNRKENYFGIEDDHVCIQFFNDGRSSSYEIDMPMIYKGGSYQGMTHSSEEVKRIVNEFFEGVNITEKYNLQFITFR